MSAHTRSGITPARAALLEEPLEHNGRSQGKSSVVGKQHAGKSGAGGAGSAGNADDGGGGGADERGGERGSLESRTRRWGYRRSAKPKIMRNGFGPVATLFFFPLAAGLVPQQPGESKVQQPGQRQNRDLLSHPDAPQLVSQTLMALAAFTECARVSRAP